ncbi:hypothetical protein AGDE_07127 [Angomonas deanei]|nr:hypothetical protein AGDE_07127 [Angomonas deanei]|eukprot:EPY36012.1 hypothetical protein AGDE_07127 [Angomonas deanei]
MSKHTSEENEYPKDEPRQEEPQEDQSAEEKEETSSSSKSSSDAGESEHPSDTESMAELRKETRDGGNVDIRAKPTAGGKNVVLFHTIVSFCSFALMLTASCPVQWMKAGNGDKWTLWKNYDGTKWADYKCDHKRQMFQAMAAFSIIATVSSLGSFLAGLLQLVGVGHFGVTAAFGFFTFAMTLVCWALIANQYHAYNCPGEISYVHHINRLYAGFALSISSCGIMFCSVVATLYYMWSKFSRPESAKQYSPVALVCCFISFGTLTIATVGSAFDFYVQYFLQYTVKVTLWHIQLEDREMGASEYYSYKDYNCKALNSYFKAGQAFSIIGAAFLFLAFLFNIAAVYKKVMKIPTIIFMACSAVFTLICWAIMVGARYKKFCPDARDIRVADMYAIPAADGLEQRVFFEGYHIVDGLAMIISAFAITVVNVIIFAVKG